MRRAGITLLRLEPDDSDPEFSNEFGVLPENWEAWQVFRRLHTQWKLGAFGGFFGLDYPGVQVVIGFRAPADPTEVFEQIQIMERAALPVLNA